MYSWQIKERDHMRLFSLFMIFYVVLTYITVVGHGLSFITVTASLAVFMFWMTFNPQIFLPLLALVVLYHVAPDCQTDKRHHKFN